MNSWKPDWRHMILKINIARGTTDPGYWVYNLNHVSDWNQFESISDEKVYSSFELNTLGPLCLWQCLVPFSTFVSFWYFLALLWYFLVQFGIFSYIFELFGTFGSFWYFFTYFNVLLVLFGTFLVLLGTFSYFLVHFQTFWYFLVPFLFFLVFVGSFWALFGTF